VFPVTPAYSNTAQTCDASHTGINTVSVPAADSLSKTVQFIVFASDAMIIPPNTYTGWPRSHRTPTNTLRRYGVTFKSFFMWSCIVDRGTPSSDDRFCVDFIGERSMEGQPLHTFPSALFFSHSALVVALRGGALLNRSRNAAVTWDKVCPVCCLSCTHTLATKRSSIE
jgi:hypothetical protein